MCRLHGQLTVATGVVLCPQSVWQQEEMISSKASLKSNVESIHGGMNDVLCWFSFGCFVQPHQILGYTDFTDEETGSPRG